MIWLLFKHNFNFFFILFLLFYFFELIDNMNLSYCNFIKLYLIL